MLTLIEALDYRCLRYISQPLGPMHVLVGPNASGKTTFLDVVSFLGDLVADGLEAAIGKRTRNFADLTWGRNGTRFELAIEARIPDEIFGGNSGHWRLRYEVACGVDSGSGEFGIQEEHLFLEGGRDRYVERPPSVPPRPFPQEPMTVPTILRAPRTNRDFPNSITRIISRGPDGRTSFYATPTDDHQKPAAHKFKLGPRRSALANLPADETQFSRALWLKDFLERGVRTIELDGRLLRNASAPGQPPSFHPQGANLPWLVEEFHRQDPARFTDWLAHLATALPDLTGVRVVEREDDRHRYLMLRYRGGELEFDEARGLEYLGFEVPSWVVSDGTLRLLALTLLAYRRNVPGIYMIEEPENGIHPRAVETMFQSLSSVYDAQILLATHSPVILSLADRNQLLCFAKAPSGATDIIDGDRHPALEKWHGEVNLGVLFASGVLG